MAEKKLIIDVVLRSKRQITLPKEVCERLRIGPGDMLELTLEDSTLVARPKKVAALEALREIREAFKHSGITEGELQDAGSRGRQEVIRKRYAAKS
ncbi:MAG: AbrB/MazE/SpoVT family DNA-binding domain-containing protein [Chloroflexi bacterium]|nr:AbrB/MazE/SpoVT family DNA-binding domain-containing protein [Chloroflexota bacterium]